MVEEIADYTLKAGIVCGVAPGGTCEVRKQWRVRAIRDSRIADG
jgi:hypothetical protein